MSKDVAPQADLHEVQAKAAQETRSGWRGRFGLGIFAINILVLAFLQWRYDWIQYLTPDHIAGTIDWMKSELEFLGPWGPMFVLFIGILLVPANFPPFPTILVCVALYGWALGGLLVFLSFFLGISLVYVIAQRLGRATVEAYFSKGLGMVNKYMSGRHLLSVVVARLVLYMNPIANWILCVSDVSYRNIVLGTLLGAAPVALLQIWLSTAIIDIARHGGDVEGIFPLHYGAILAAALLLLLSLRFVWGRLAQLRTRNGKV